ncbi:uncharacterized protein [Bemisia tabaci]|uniref:uncharacterized protein n=1 Tax=Bemisia tabaci TaxID=7038 RepID=UPI003B27C085
MSVLKSVCILFFGTITQAAIISAIDTSHGHAIQIYIGEKTYGGNQEAELSSLQTREPITLAITVASLVMSNLHNIEPALTAIRDVMRLLNPLATASTRLENGGQRRSDGTIFWKGRLLEFNTDEGVHVFVISPEKSLMIVTSGKRVLLNDYPVCQNTDQLGEPQYRKLKLQDKKEETKLYTSWWYTNLVVGNPMTEEEVTQFMNLQKEVQIEREKAVNDITAVAREKIAKAVGLGLKLVDVPAQMTMEAVRGAVGGVVAAPRMAVSAAGALGKGVNQGWKSVVTFSKDSLSRDSGGTDGISGMINSRLWGPMPEGQQPPTSPLPRTDSQNSPTAEEVNAMIHKSNSGRMDGLNRWLFGSPPRGAPQKAPSSGFKLSGLGKKSFKNPFSRKGSSSG